MKPLRLTVEGFTSFRERLELDFSGLDLFAITGPTGAGKSSLIDAIVFALYGQVPRVGDDYKQLISHGAERLSVLFEFAVGRERYRIARAARRDRASQQRLERLGDSGVVPVADRVREIRAEVERLLGLDYDGFTRSVVLPQGQFDAFLKGEPKERRKILVALLGLGVYERMQQLANQKGAAARAEAEFIRRQLETDYAFATADALQRARAELCSAEAAAHGAEGDLARLTKAAALAHAARAARREAEALGREAEETEQSLATAEAVLARDAPKAAELGGRISRLDGQIGAQAVDEQRCAALTGALPRLEQQLAVRARLTSLASQIASRQQDLGREKAELESAAARLPATEQDERRAAEAEAAAREARDAARLLNLSAALRRALEVGRPCPVCAQPVKALAETVEPVLDGAERLVREAETARQSAGSRLQELRLALARRQAAIDGIVRELRQLEEQQVSARTQAGEADAALRQAGFLPIQIADAEGLAAQLQAELREIDAARRGRAELERARQSLAEQHARLSSAILTASERQAASRARLAQLAERRRAAAHALDEARRALLAMADDGGWPGVERPPARRDEADVVEALRSTAQRACTEAATRRAGAAHEVERIEGALARVAELSARRAALQARADLHKTLADHLKANELVAWVQEEALRRLALEGSRHLSLLSQGRYELRLGGAGEDEATARAEQDFCVIDHWNGGSVRSVRTLSGGETFLASLSLALALAESLAQLSSERRATDALESLFLDEGFGALDTETLDTVTGALDALHGGQRVVGIVTHVRELAERLPARLEVRRLGIGSGSTAAVV